MNSRYIFFILIPVFFGLTSCNSSKPVEPAVFEFSHKITGTEKIEAIQTKEIKPEAKKTTEKQSVETQNTDLEEKDIKPLPEKQPIKDTENHFIKRFNIGYLTFNVGDFYAELKPIESTDNYTRYYFRLFSRSNNFIDYLFGWRSNTVSIFKTDDKGVYPESFQSKILLKNKAKEMEITYDASGKKIASEQIIPPDNRDKRPAVPEKLKVATYPPLPMAFEARRLVIKAFKENNFNQRGVYTFTLPLYDGRRRSDINFILTKKKVNDFYYLKISEKQLAGYTDNELKDIKKGDKTVDIYLDTKNFWPVSAIAKSPLGSAKAIFLQNCSNGFEECIKLSETQKKDSN